MWDFSPSQTLVDRDVFPAFDEEETDDKGEKNDDGGRGSRSETFPEALELVAKISADGTSLEPYQSLQPRALIGPSTPRQRTDDFKLFSTTLAGSNSPFMPKQPNQPYLGGAVVAVDDFEKLNQRAKIKHSQCVSVLEHLDLAQPINALTPPPQRLP
ncbi:uncharacterized protein HKW66_Vig0109080 [Vigna angularis]|uniref:Uncharacterized protein n=1 Tax=Phaseolus angularis TaxID=3914 RepID=A0A8T0KW62_PHAAN|nr:uncharacterized protein HKW66_Vig0109080 [Vigna angularis]